MNWEIWVIRVPEKSDFRVFFQKKERKKILPNSWRVIKILRPIGMGKWAHFSL